MVFRLEHWWLIAGFQDWNVVVETEQVRFPVIEAQESFALT